MENPSIAALCRNEWIQLAAWDPESASIHVYRRGKFEPYQPEACRLPHAAGSADWYRGLREHLPFAQISGSA